MGGIIKQIPAPSWRKGATPINVGINPTLEELDLLKKIERSSKNGSGYGDLRVLIPQEKGGSHYLWPASDAFHSDVGNYFQLNPQKYKHGIMEGD